MSTEAVLIEVGHERHRQETLWGTQDHDESTWLAILTEEVGEVAKEVADWMAGARALNPRQYRTELVQVAAVAVAAVEALDRSQAVDLHSPDAQDWRAR